jgi:putative RNA 2'-phosphotransferase
MTSDLLRLSKAVSHALRHEPWLYELELDDEGWVPVEELLSALRAEKPEWSTLSEADLAKMIAASDKKRHELHDGKIRALYGHSVPDKLLKQLAEPPVVLYHGTSPETAALIKTSGLQPMSRQYVHLSVNTATAEQVGRRKAHAPVLLEVQAKVAAESGVAFYRGNDLVWLADQVPAQFIVFPG